MYTVDPTGRDVRLTIAARTARPLKYSPARPVRDTAADCPFCPGQPDAQAEGLCEQVAGGHRVWATRNAFPLTSRHELVLIDAHEAHLHTVPLPTLKAVTATVSARTRIAARDGGHVTSWLSYGAQSGASQDHPHAQVAALGVTPPGVQAEWRAQQPGACMVCDASPVATVGGVAVLAPETARDGELLLATPRHGQTLPGAGHAPALAAALAGLGEVFCGCAYNLVWHAFTGQFGHEHVHLVPRLTTRSSINALEGWYECRTVGGALADLVGPVIREYASQWEA